MIHVSFEEPAGNEQWAKWRKAADKRIAKVIADFKEGKTIKISQPFYTKMRQVFLDAFNGKCAYCEAMVILDQHQGDVEHFRPKGSVTDHEDRPVTVSGPNGEPQPHRGYPGLAYDWRNLLPSCRACNQPGTTRDGRRVGKWGRFPVAGFRAMLPEEVEQERPLLLNPVPVEDIERHLDFRPKTGWIYGKTPEGRMTERVLDLNREGLPEARRKVYFTVTLTAKAATGDGPLEERKMAAELLRSYHEGREPYSWVGRLAMRAFPPPDPLPAEA